MKRAFVIILVFLGGAAGAFAQESNFPHYAGSSTCRTCHAAGQSAPPCRLEPIPKHDHTFDLLSTSRATDIAALSGASTSPTETQVCLSCHSTGADDGPRWWGPAFRQSDGVQCESCHGPGSLHIAKAQSSADAAYFQASGPLLIRRGDRNDCHDCHTNRPSHHEVVQGEFSRDLADFLYKTPVDLALSPDGGRLYVVCEHSDSVLVVDVDKAAVVQEIRVGHSPKAAAIGMNGRFLYVTNAMSGTVSVIDVQKGEEVNQIAVGAEPHGVLVDPSNQFLYVLNTGEDSISVVEVPSGREARRLAGGVGPWAIATGGAGHLAAVSSVRPNLAQFRDPPVSEVTLLDTRRGVVVERINVPGANMLQGVAWIPGTQTALVTMMRTKNLVSAIRLSQGWMITHGLAVIREGGRVDQVLLDRLDDAVPDLIDLAVSPDGRWALVSSGGGDVVVVIDVPKLMEYIEQQDDQRRADLLPDFLGSAEHVVVKRIGVGANPRGLRFSPDGAKVYVCNALSDTISILDVATWEVLRTIDLGGPREISPLRHGERLFHNAEITFGRQFSCRSCHPDGHSNGLTFDIEADGPGMKPLDNRTLRGILDTGPFKWEGTNPSLARQCGARFAVFFTRQAPYPPQDLDDLMHYIATIERPPNRFRHPEGLTDAQRRGKAVFERTSKSDGTPLKPLDRCTTCHNGAYRTNRQKFAISTTFWFDATVEVDLRDLFNVDEYGELGTYYFMDTGMPSVEWDVPQLTDIATSAPYLHNGAAHTLEEIWARYNMINKHGAVHGMSRQDFNDLMAYLKAL